MLVKDLVLQLNTLYPKTLDTLTLGQLTNFAALSADVLNRTNDGYGYSFSRTHAPVEFMSQCLGPGQPQTTWARLWILTYPHLHSCLYDPTLISKYGIPSVTRPNNAVIIPERSYRPPNTHCITCKSKKRNTAVQLMIRPPVYGYVFDIGGIETMQYISGYCTKCHQTYMPCFTRKNGLREYYTKEEGQPANDFQVTQHYFMSHQLADHLNHLQMYGVVSIYNLVATYNQAHAPISSSPPPNDFGNCRYTQKLSTNVASLALDIHRLMKRTNDQSVRLMNRTQDDSYSSNSPEYLVCTMPVLSVVPSFAIQSNLPRFFDNKFIQEYSFLARLFLHQSFFHFIITSIQR
ncbi:hypothetical protein DFH28DRAFT_1070026 [Melampsora americana]|nr:hypothetical protein DFH28DRAFT_1070026 [Melampsora americana]